MRVYRSVEFGIVGMGSVGTLLAYFLNSAGIVPYAVARTPRARYVLRIRGEEHEVHVRLVERLPPAVSFSLVAVKAYDTESVLGLISGVPVVFQNGIGGLELVRERLGRGLGAVVTYGATRRGGVVELRGFGEFILPEEAGALADILKAGGASVRVVADVEPYRWLKVAVNAAINPITAVLGVKNGFVAEDPHARAVALSAAREAAVVAERLGVRLPADPIEETLRVASATRDNCSSMLQDLSAGGRTEVDYINGAVVKYGARVGVEAPVNFALWSLVKALESTRSFKGHGCLAS
ncbi:MAG: ketopantoate reductase family protein [Thermoproteus sp.]